MSKTTKLRLIRKGFGLPMSRLAMGIGLNPNTLGSIERRELACPSKWRLPLAKALASEPGTLFDVDGLALPV